MRNLTNREAQILELIEHGKTYRDIASLLGISPQTVKIHVKNIRQKYGVIHTNFKTILLRSK